MKDNKKQINVVWCDDNIDNLTKSMTLKEMFNDHHCQIYETAKTSEQLLNILQNKKNFIDAVIVDFNMDKINESPDKDKAGGFMSIHNELKNYPSIPFYLCSGRDMTFIENKYREFELKIEGDYFFSNNPLVSGKRNRHFCQDDIADIEDMLNMIEEEVEVRCTPTYRIRQEYSEAFAAIDKFGLNGDVFINILKYDKKKDQPIAEIVITSANSLRIEIEKLMSQFQDEEIIPEDIELNRIPNLLAGKDEDSNCYKPDDLMPEALYTAFKRLLVDYTQDGSHGEHPDKNINLKLHFRKYLESEKDIYIVKALAIICLDIIRWASTFYDKYKSKHLFIKFEPFDAEVKELVTIDNGKEGAIVYDSDGKSYFCQQQSAPFLKYKVGTNVNIDKRSKATGAYSAYDYFCKNAWNLDVSKPR